jgi:hypothetical protein
MRLAGDVTKRERAQMLRHCGAFGTADELTDRCCDGASSAFAGDANDASVSFPFRWLTLIAAVPPSTDGTVYGSIGAGSQARCTAPPR